MSYISPVFDVTKFGAVGDGTTNDYAAISSALTAALAVDGTLYFPAGRYRINTVLSFSNATHSLTLKGDGPNVSVIVVGATGVNGLNFNFDQVGASQPYGLVVEDLGFACMVAPAGTAIVVSANPSGGVSNEHQLPTVTMRNMHVRSDYANAGGQFTWSNGVDITNCWNVCMTDCYITGSAAGAAWNNLTGKGIALHRSCVNSHFLNCHCNFWATGFFYDTGSTDDDANTEGLFFSNCSFVAVKKGVWITGNPNFSLDTGDLVSAGSFKIGDRYKIASPGTPSFTAIGAPNNTVGTYFTATGVGTGTGTAYHRLPVPRVDLLTWTGGLVELRVGGVTTGSAAFQLVNVWDAMITGMMCIAEQFGVGAGNFITGNYYQIAQVGTTSFTAIGASSNTVGVVFQATGPGSGNGVATNYDYAIFLDKCESVSIKGCSLSGLNSGVFTTGTCNGINTAGNVFSNCTNRTYFGASTTNSVSSGQTPLDGGLNEVNVGGATNKIYHGAGYGAMVWLNSGQTTATATDATISWSDVYYNNLSIWSGGDPTKLRVPPGVNRVRVSAGMRWTPNAVGNRSVRIRSNPGGYYAANSIWAASEHPAGATGDCVVSTGIIDVADLTYFDLVVSQNSGGNLSTSSGRGVWFQMEVLG